MKYRAQDKLSAFSCQKGKEMKRRDLLKLSLVAPFVGLLKSKKKEIAIASGCPSSPSSSSASMSGHPSATNSVEPTEDFVVKQHFCQFQSEIVGITTFEGNLWIATKYNGLYVVKEEI